MPLFDNRRFQPSPCEVDRERFSTLTRADDDCIIRSVSNHFALPFTEWNLNNGAADIVAAAQLRPIRETCES
jgi:hypothetical protein